MRGCRGAARSGGCTSGDGVRRRVAGIVGVGGVGVEAAAGAGVGPGAGVLGGGGRGVCRTSMQTGGLRDGGVSGEIRVGSGVGTRGRVDTGRSGEMGDWEVGSETVGEGRMASCTRGGGA